MGAGLGGMFKRGAGPMLRTWGKAARPEGGPGVQEVRPWVGA